MWMVHPNRTRWLHHVIFIFLFSKKIQNLNLLTLAHPKSEVHPSCLWRTAQSTVRCNVPDPVLSIYGKNGWQSTSRIVIGFTVYAKRHDWVHDLADILVSATYLQWVKREREQESRFPTGCEMQLSAKRSTECVVFNHSPQIAPSLTSHAYQNRTNKPTQ